MARSPRYELMPRYVILHHEMPPEASRATHWDFMLEVGDVLQTWALAEELTIGKTVVAEQLVDHRLAYLTYEGPVSGDRGTVTQWDSGSYELLEDSSGKVIRLNGKRCVGVVTLTQDTTDQRWSVSLRKS